MTVLVFLLSTVYFRIIACNNLTPEQKRIQITKDVYEFLSKIGERAIKMFSDYHVQTKKEQSDCFSSLGGLLMRTRCCVYYSSIAASLLYVRFDPTSTYDFNKLDAVTVDWLMRLWAIQNDERDGIYSMEMEISGVKGTLLRCEFLDVHTYLLFVSPEIDKDILIDVSFKQFLVYHEFIKDSQDYYKLAEMTKDVDPVFVGTKDVFFERYSPLKLLSYTVQLLGDKSPTSEVFLEFYKTLYILFGDWAKQNICGKATSKYFGTTDIDEYVTKDQL